MNIRGLTYEILGSHSIVVFTGAGVSTDSGIPDYRSQGGIWQRFQPVYYDEFLSDEEKRRLHWERKIATWPAIRDAEPGAAHRFVKRLYDEGRLHGLITQNIDGLHEKSGVDPEVIVNIHGNTKTIRCMQCSWHTGAGAVLETLDLSHGTPRCPECGGLVKPDTIMFGQSLKGEDLYRAQNMAESTDLFIAMGSTLVVHPAAGLPLRAKDAGATLAILTQSETPLDAHADYRFFDPIATVLQRIEEEMDRQS